ncbi:hypothetical protein BDV28DRAFT_102283 [Aspergillus coremiiformis]|uniref:Uncharacterized protein n=1 Tax=Aspergillus coremiiformis TaxID=138285 RepID=A0A5N6YS44_9EURO|nr:hypothetical protein BDV28DRAFT_102283 [Aspergillus coremiiformis]
MAQHPDVGVYHGKKRPAESDPDGDQPLAKKFGCLHIDPVTIAHASGETTGDFDLAPEDSPLTSTDMMMLDDTKHTIYIHDLEREIAEAELPCDHVTFLPVVGESLGAIPRFIVAEPGPACNELVLYREPTFLTVPKETDTLSKALSETRERARRSQRGRHFCAYSTPVSGVVADTSNSNDTHSSDDAMEMDAKV